MAERPIIELPWADQPRASIVICATGAGLRLRGCLTALADSVRGDVPFETIIVLDGGDQSALERLRADVSGAQIESPTVSIGLAAALNRARAQARGEFLVSLHDDAQVNAGWLEALVETADARPDAGAVGSLMLHPDGTLQAAGREVLPDASTRPAWGRSVTDLGHTTVVDQVGSAAVLFRTSSWDEMGGADERLFPAYYVDVDICLAIRAHGREVLLEPRSKVRHGQGSSTRPHYANFLLRRNRQLTAAKWGAVLSCQLAGSGSTGLPKGVPMPCPVREYDSRVQERAQLVRGLETLQAYIASLDRLTSRQWRRRVRVNRLDASLNTLSRGGWRSFRRRHLKAVVRRARG